MEDDARLVAAALSDGAEAFGRIVERYQAGVFGVALARLRNFHDAEDVAQGVFVEAFERLDRLRDPGRLGAWLRSMAIHHCIDRLRQRRHVTGIEAIDAHISDTDTPHRNMEQQELRGRVMTAIGRLSKTQRETTALFYIDGYSQEEIAGMQEVPIGTVKRRLHDARNRLREEMMDMVEEVLKDGAPKADFANRVFELLCQYPEPKRRGNWEAMVSELRRIGTPGVEGFIKAFALPHWRTRRFTIHMLGDAPPQDTQVVIDLLKQGLKDANKRVRRHALQSLMDLDVSDARKRREFIPLVADLLFDPSKRVRRCASQAWILGACAEDMPPDKVAAALKQETDPQIRRMMQRLLIQIIEGRGQDSGARGQ